MEATLLLRLGLMELVFCVDSQVPIVCRAWTIRSLNADKKSSYTWGEGVVRKNSSEMRGGGCKANGA